jgi:signal recognition particle receptor subunit beta
MFDHKIIVTGPVGVGKTTAIEAYSKQTALHTEVRASDDTALIKSSTTVAMDYASMVLDEETKVHLYGTPGQQRFDFMWSILSLGAMGLIILVDYKDNDDFSQLQSYLDAFSVLIEGVPTVLGVNRVPDGLSPTDAIMPYHDYLQSKDFGKISVHAVDVRQSDDVEALVLKLLLADIVL